MDNATSATDGLIKTVKMIAHTWNDNLDAAKKVENSIANKLELPDWDDVPIDQKIIIYQTAWKQLAEEGYDYATDNI